METQLQSSLVNVTAGLAEAAGDSIKVRHAQATSPGDLAALVDSEWSVVSRARSVVVDAAGSGLSESDVRALVRLASYGVRVIVTGPDPVGCVAPLTILHEPAFARAAVASIYALAPGQTALLVTRDSGNTPQVTPLVRHALRWRASWQDPEAGDLSAVPV